MEHQYKDARIILKLDTQLCEAVVVVGGRGTRYWLTEAWKYNDCASLARYFYKKHREGVDDAAWLKKAEKKPVVHEPHTVQAFTDWLYEHQWEVVGRFGHYDTPVSRYIKATRDSWKKGSFLYAGCYQNKPRWMDRLDHFCAEQFPDAEVLGCTLLARMRDEGWDTKYYDLHAHMQRLSA